MSSHHTHEHPHHHSEAGANEDLVLLTYMLEHNRHHLEELRETAQRLEAAGQNNINNLLSQSLRLLDESNQALAQAISQWKGRE